MSTRHELTLSRVIDSPPEKLYRCWTEPELLRQWFCPKPYTVSYVELDVRPGGSSNIVMRSPEGAEIPCPGIYLEVVPNRKIVTTDAYTSAWEPSEKAFMTAIVTFEDLGDGRTRYTAIARHWNEEDKKAHEAMGFHEGWGKAADQLAELAATLDLADRQHHPAPPHSAPPARTASPDSRHEEQVRALIENWTKAIRSGDRAGILAHHSPEVLMYDFPRVEHGLQAYDRTWDYFYAHQRGPIEFSPSELKVVAGGDVAFASCLIHCDGTSAGPLDLRLTAGLRKIHGQWTVLHEHHSLAVPEENYVDSIPARPSDAK